jgi:hypothetical protein
MYVFGETEGDGPARKRPRACASVAADVPLAEYTAGEPFVLGTVKHEASVLPTIGAEYKEIVRQRQAKADAPRRRRVPPCAKGANLVDRAQGTSP